MTTRRSRVTQHAFTLLELLVLFFVLLILFLTIPNTARGTKQKNLRIACVNNLKNIGLAQRVFATDNNDRFPSEVAAMRENPATNDVVALLTTLTNEIASPKIFHCPADTSRTPATNWSQFTTRNISYFFAANASETYPQSFLAGDNNLLLNGKPIPSGRVSISTNAALSFDNTRHNIQGNFVMGDGSVQQLSNPRLQQTLQSAGLPEMELILP